MTVTTIKNLTSILSSRNDLLILVKHLNAHPASDVTLCPLQQKNKCMKGSLSHHIQLTNDVCPRFLDAISKDVTKESLDTQTMPMPVVSQGQREVSFENFYTFDQKCYNGVHLVIPKLLTLLIT